MHSATESVQEGSPEELRKIYFTFYPQFQRFKSKNKAFRNYFQTVLEDFAISSKIPKKQINQLSYGEFTLS